VYKFSPAASLALLLGCFRKRGHRAARGTAGGSLSSPYPSFPQRLLHCSLPKSDGAPHVYLAAQKHGIRSAGKNTENPEIPS